MLDYLSLLDIFVLASPDGGGSNVLLEAKYAGISTMVANKASEEEHRGRLAYLPPQGAAIAGRYPVPRNTSEPHNSRKEHIRWVTLY